MGALVHSLDEVYRNYRGYVYVVRDPYDGPAQRFLDAHFEKIAEDLGSTSVIVVPLKGAPAEPEIRSLFDITNEDRRPVLVFTDIPPDGQSGRTERAPPWSDDPRDIAAARRHIVKVSLDDKDENKTREFLEEAMRHFKDLDFDALWWLDFRNRLSKLARRLRAPFSAVAIFLDWYRR